MMGQATDDRHSVYIFNEVNDLPEILGANETLCMPFFMGSNLERPSFGRDEDGRISDGHQQQDHHDGYERPRLKNSAQILEHDTDPGADWLSCDRLLRIVAALRRFGVPVKLGALAAAQMS